MIPIFTSIDIQEAVIALLQQNLAASPLLQTDAVSALQSPVWVPASGSLVPTTIFDDDPGSASPGEIKIAFHLLADDDTDGTSGPAGAGTRRTPSFFAALVYVGEANKDPTKKRTLGLLTKAVREALMADNVRIDPSPTVNGMPCQRWYENEFFKSPATFYQSGSAFRRSITFVKFNSRVRTYGPQF